MTELLTLLEAEGRLHQVRDVRSPLKSHKCTTSLINITENNEREKKVRKLRILGPKGWNKRPKKEFNFLLWKMLVLDKIITTYEVSEI